MQLTMIIAGVQPQAMTQPDDEWLAYYAAFPQQAQSSIVQFDCHPRRLQCREARGTVVLIHGLSDSPRYLLDIARYFHESLQYNVLMPLLQGHGLAQPDAMVNVTLESWQANVAFALEEAGRLTPRRVAIGGLSTGATLGLHAAMTTPQFNGEVLLFSAALALQVAGNRPAGWLVEHLLLSRRVVAWREKQNQGRPQWGDNPYKYTYVNDRGAAELVRLIRAINRLLANGKLADSLRIFAAHSHCDQTASLSSVQRLERLCQPGNYRGVYLAQEEGVEHDAVVLRNPIVGHSGKPSSLANPHWLDMMGTLADFMSR
jgi:esterase/lipase